METFRILLPVEETHRQVAADSAQIGPVVEVGAVELECPHDVLVDEAQVVDEVGDHTVYDDLVVRPDLILRHSERVVHLRVEAENFLGAKQAIVTQPIGEGKQLSQVKDIEQIVLREGVRAIQENI